MIERYRIQHRTVYDYDCKETIGELLATNVTEDGIEILIGINGTGEVKKFILQGFMIDTSI